MNSLTFRHSLPIVLLALSGKVGAVGLGELRGQPVLGQGLQLEVSLLGAEKLALEASCFRLVQPSDGGDLPWLKKASLAFRKGAPPVLEIRSAEPLREPILQLAVKLGCGYEVSRDYVLMASPAIPGMLRAEPLPEKLGEAGVPPVAKRPARARSAQPRLASEVPAPVRRVSKATANAEALLPDRLILFADGDVGEPSLRLATALVSTGQDATDAQREMFRLEYRMLMALHDQAISQLAAAEKMRNMESALGELHGQADKLAQRAEQGSASSPQGSGSGQGAPVPSVAAPASAQVATGGSAPVKALALLSDWGAYGILLGSVLGLAGWLVWRNHRRRQDEAVDGATTICEPEIRVDPRRSDERDEPGGVDLPFEPAAMGMPMQVDVELDARGGVESVAPVDSGAGPEKAMDSVLSINASTLDEQFEANPVMELADIMLSFGRVKGAAQALQEYIDNNPQEALRPWIRLMDVYRMAGMRAEFEKVASNLNHNFNVEVQSWDDGKAESTPPSPGTAEIPVAPKPQSLEDLPRLMRTVVELWNTGDVVGYLYQLLRDNRGGQRLGFAMPVVEDVLFLIELKETANRMDKVQ